MKKIDVDSEEYIFFSCNGKTLDIPVLFGMKQPVIFVVDEMVEDEDEQRKAIEEINEFLALNPALDNVIVAPYPVDYNFQRFLKFENLFYKEYDNILEPERVSLRTIEHFASRVNEDETVRMCCSAFPLTQCKEVDNKLNLFIKDIKNSNLSSFEKILASYLICTHFVDSFKENDENEDTDYDVYSSVLNILSDTDYGYKVKCAGYTDLFCRLLSKLDIETIPMLISCSDIDFYHSVAKVSICDEKYGINGQYICDVRGDSDYREAFDRKKLDELDKNLHGYYYTYNSLMYFALTFDDYNYLINPNLEQMIYSTVPLKSGAEDLISKNRVELTNISNALMKVSLFTYLSDGNDEISTGDDALEKIVKESNKSTAKIGSCRKKSDQFYSNLLGKEK